MRDAIRDRLGIYYDDNKRMLLQSRLQTRLAIRSAGSFKQYYQYLTNDADREAEWNELASVLSNNETYFFREPTQLDVLTGEVLDEALHRHGVLRVWSAACSTGEEPYSLAIALLESGKIPASRVRLTASDISPRVLERASAGIYRELSLRATPAELVPRYFSPIAGGFLISDRIKRMVEFFRINLIESRAVEGAGPVDAIFCRNVLMYFDKPTRKRVVESFAKALGPRGFLFLGHAESLIGLTDVFDPVVTRKAIYYRRSG